MIGFDGRIIIYRYAALALRRVKKYEARNILYSSKKKKKIDKRPYHFALQEYTIYENNYLLCLKYLC